MDIVSRVYWWYWEVIVFNVRVVCYVVVFKFFVRVLFCFRRVNFVERICYVSVEVYVIKKEKFWFWVEEICVIDVS